MPKKKKEEVATAPLPPIDHAYVQAIKIQNLEERNEALREELEKLRLDHEQVKLDETDVHEHMQRDLRSKSEKIAELQKDLQDTRAQLEEALSSKEENGSRARELFEEERTRNTHEMQKLRAELHEVKAFQERRAELEGQLFELRKQVDELKTRHEREVNDMKREFDLKYAEVHTQCNAKVKEMENSVEARAMERVDAVTKKTITINTRQRNEIENLHKEIDQIRRKMERGIKENQALRLEVEVKSEELAENKGKISGLQATVSDLNQTLHEHGAAEANWHQTLVLQMMVRSLEDRVAKQALQIMHYQRRAEGKKGGGSRRTLSVNGSAAGSLKEPVNSALRSSAAVYNFVGAFPQGGGLGVREGMSVQKDSLMSGDWFAPLDSGAAPLKGASRARTTGVGAVRSGGKVKVPPLMNVSKTDVTAMLLAATDSEIAASISALAADANPVDSTRAVTYR
jgi:chromosome segregation ATPase